MPFLPLIPKTIIIHLQSFIMMKQITLECWRIIRVINSGRVLPACRRQGGGVRIGKIFNLMQEHPRRKKNNIEALAFFKVNKYDRDYQIWKREPLSIELISPAVFEQKIDYIHYNPRDCRLMH